MTRRIALSLLMTLALAAAKTPRPLAKITITGPPGGKKINLAAYPGKVMLIVIFSTGCETCVPALQFLDRLQAEYRDRGVVIAGAAADPPAISTIKSLIDRFKIKIPLGVLTEDEARRLADAGPTEKLTVPAFLFVDKKGIVRSQNPGDSGFFKDRDRNTRLLLDGLLRE